MASQRPLSEAGMATPIDASNPIHLAASEEGVPILFTTAIGAIAQPITVLFRHRRPAKIANSIDQFSASAMGGCMLGCRARPLERQKNERMDGHQFAAPLYRRADGSITIGIQASIQQSTSAPDAAKRTDFIGMVTGNEAPAFGQEFFPSRWRMWASTRQPIHSRTSRAMPFPKDL